MADTKKPPAFLAGGPPIEYAPDGYCAECDALAELDRCGRCALCADFIKQQLLEENDGLPG